MPSLSGAGDVISQPIAGSARSPDLAVRMRSRAAKEGHTEVVQLLLSNKAPQRIANGHGMLPMHLAVRPSPCPFDTNLLHATCKPLKSSCRPKVRALK